MTIGVLINARCGSKRLPKKHLRDIAGHLAIDRLIARLLPVKDVTFIVATGHEAENEPLRPIAEAHKIAIVFGDPNNIPNRHLQIARKHNLEAIVSIDADDILTSPRALTGVINALNEGKHLVRTRGLPLGMNILWAYTLETLIQAVNTDRKGSFDTCWGWIFDHIVATKGIHYINLELPDAHLIRATLDYPEDLRFFRRVYEQCPPDTINDDDALCKWIIHNRAYRINHKRSN